MRLQALTPQDTEELDADIDSDVMTALSGNIRFACASRSAILLWHWQIRTLWILFTEVLENKQMKYHGEAMSYFLQFIEYWVFSNKQL